MTTCPDLQGQQCENCDVKIHLLCVVKLARGRYVGVADTQQGGRGRYMADVGVAVNWAGWGRGSVDLLGELVSAFLTI